MKLLSPVAGELEQKQTIPEPLAALLVPAASYKVYCTPCGNSILIQEIVNDKGVTRMVDAVCVAGETLLIQEDKPLIEMLFSLQDSVLLAVNSLQLTLHERALNVLYNNTLFKELTLRANTTVCFVSILWPPAAFQQYISVLNRYEQFFARISNPSPALLSKGNAIVNSWVLFHVLIVRNLADHNRVTTALQSIIETSVALLNDKTHKPPRIKQDTIDKVYAFKNYLVTHLNEQLPIHQTAKQFLNARNLQNYFPRLFACPVKTFLHDERMLKAVELLIDNNKIEYIASQLGYSHASTFINAFQSFYHMSPTDFRQKNFEIL